MDIADFARNVTSRMLRGGRGGRGAAIDVRYEYNGRSVPAVELRGPRTEVITGFSQIKADLMDALAWIRTATSVCEREAHDLDGQLGFDTGETQTARGLFIGAVTFYGKAFTSCPGRRARLEPESLDQRFHDAHEWCMTYRHAYAAHSGEEKIERSTLYLLFHPNRKHAAALLPIIRVEGARPNLALVAPDGTALEDLLEHAISVAQIKKQKAGQALIDKEVKKKGFEHWYSAAKKRKIVTI